MFPEEQVQLDKILRILYRASMESGEIWCKFNSELAVFTWYW